MSKDKRSKDSNKPLDAQSIIDDAEEEKEEQWAFLRPSQLEAMGKEAEQLYRTKGIAQLKSQRIPMRQLLSKDDTDLELILNKPLPLHPQIPQHDMTSLGNRSLMDYLTQLWARKDALNEGRKRALAADYKDEKDRELRVQLIDKALELINYALDNPLASPENIDLWTDTYERTKEEQRLPPQNVETITSQKTTKQNKPAKAIDWSLVTIALMANQRIGYKFTGSKDWKNMACSKVNLIDARKNTLNMAGGVLLDLANGKKFPPGYKKAGTDKHAIKRLRISLKKLLGANNNPFFKFEKNEGWKPRFEIVDRRSAADERAMEKAGCDSFDDSTHGASIPDYADLIDKERFKESPTTPDDGDSGHTTQNYEDEDDEGGRWLRDGPNK